MALCGGVSCFTPLFYMQNTLFRESQKRIQFGTKHSNRVNFQALNKKLIDCKLFFINGFSSTFFNLGLNQFEKNTKSAKSGLKTKNRGFQVL